MASSQSRIVDDRVHASIGRKERNKNDNTAAPPRVSESVGRSLSQPATHHHHSSIVTIIRNNIHNHQSFEPIMHPGGWCTYLRRVPGERARSHRHRRALRIYRSTPLHQRIHNKSSTNRTNHTNDKSIHSPRSTRVSSSKWQCQRKGGALNHSHINLHPPDA